MLLGYQKAIGTKRPLVPKGHWYLLLGYQKAIGIIGLREEALVNTKRISLVWKALSLAWSNSKSWYDPWFPEEEYWVDQHGGWGICVGINEFYLVGAITSTERNFMEDAIFSIPDNKFYPYKWSRDKKGALSRAKFCELQSQKCNNLCNVPWDQVINELIAFENYTEANIQLALDAAIRLATWVPEHIVKARIYINRRWHERNKIPIKKWCEREIVRVHKYHL